MMDTALWSSSSGQTIGIVPSAAQTDLGHTLASDESGQTLNSGKTNHSGATATASKAWDLPFSNKNLQGSIAQDHEFRAAAAALTAVVHSPHRCFQLSFLPISATLEAACLARVFRDTTVDVLWCFVGSQHVLDGHHMTFDRENARQRKKIPCCGRHRSREWWFPCLQPIFQV